MNKESIEDITDKYVENKLRIGAMKIATGFTAIIGAFALGEYLGIPLGIYFGADGFNDIQDLEYNTKRAETLKE